ncbi:MAG: ClbS/DfsB family four-helix bundle protein [Anaerolineales bacterium]|nr:ClbS/DfsB family four-helix bundle protein [Anaerolineales bacterium]
MDIKQKLSELLSQAYAEEQEFVAALTAEEREAHGALEAWSAKDLVAHTAEWKVSMAARLSVAREGGTPPAYGDLDATNADIFERYQVASWDEVLALMARSQRDLLVELAAMPEALLRDAERFPWQRGRPLWQDVAGHGFIHPLAHLVERYLRRGDTAYAQGLMEQLARRLPELDDTPSWRAVAVYNLACFHAQAGQPEQALAVLGEALRLNPGLTEWSQKDPDLASLRHLPEYRALVGG